MKSFFLYFVYEIILLIAFILYLPVAIYKMIVQGKYRSRINERFGFFSEEVRQKLSNPKVIWVHAVSVGEIAAASSLVSELRENNPDHFIVVSTVTDTGQEMAEKIIDEADQFIYFPFDFSLIVKRVLHLINPKLIVIMETELWPNFIRHADRLGAKIMLANGRISDSSAQNYNYLGPVLADMLNRIDFLSMQSEQDVERIVNLGAEPEKTDNLGNTKFDQNFAQPDSEQEEEFLNEFKLTAEQAVFVAGSTHPNEEEQLISVYQELKEVRTDLVMILAPRHVRRADELVDLYTEAGIDIVRRTKIEERSDESVILLDTIGELAQVYGLADLVFVGGSLIERGGHNILEPIAQGKLVFFGPNMSNFKANTRLALENEAGIQVEDAAKLKEELKYYLLHPDQLDEKSKQALELIENNRGASQRNADKIQEILGVN